MVEEVQDVVAAHAVSQQVNRLLVLVVHLLHKVLQLCEILCILICVRRDDRSVAESTIIILLLIIIIIRINRDTEFGLTESVLFLKAVLISFGHMWSEELHNKLTNPQS